MSKIRPIAIYLPQYHPIPENDEWWGKGFTEWTNVTKAKPLFEGHYQPHLPADLGFYDLRLEETRLEQIKLAKESGIYGFCYYHYWFNGKRLLNEPIDRMLKNPKEDFPFMLCWANENWTRAWDGMEKEVLIKQNYCEEDDIEHIRFLLPIFKDERYVKIDGKPVFVIYKSADIPNVEKTIQIWREEAAKENIALYICRMDRWNTENGQHILNLGFDAAIEFQPLSSSLREYLNKNQIRKNKHPKHILLNKIQNRIKRIQNKFMKKRSKQNVISTIDLREFVEFDNQRMMEDYKIYPCVSPSWDNSPRREKEATIFINSTPEVFYSWIKGKLNKFTPYSNEENLFFINAWNEWAEGNHLEPDRKYGRAYLEAIQKGVSEI